MHITYVVLRFFLFKANFYFYREPDAEEQQLEPVVEQQGEPPVEQGEEPVAEPAVEQPDGQLVEPPVEQVEEPVAEPAIEQPDGQFVEPVEQPSAEVLDEQPVPTSTEELPHTISEPEGITEQPSMAKAVSQVTVKALQEVIIALAFMISFVLFNYSIALFQKLHNITIWSKKHLRCSFCSQFYSSFPMIFVNRGCICITHNWLLISFKLFTL